MRPLNEIIVHCTATRPDWWSTRSTAQKVAEIKRWHVQDRGWSDIGYHFLIDRDGKVVAGRPLQTVGAHTQGHNTGTIGISLFGGHGSAATDAFFENYTPQQDKALRDLITHLRASYPTITKVSGHNEYAAKACPGFNVPKWYKFQSTGPSRMSRLAAFLKGESK
jgi:N-acetyl-anhydromuramyl-L-alanine amidase AmpD